MQTITQDQKDDVFCKNLDCECKKRTISTQPKRVYPFTFELKSSGGVHDSIKKRVRHRQERAKCG